MSEQLTNTPEITIGGGSLEEVEPPQVSFSLTKQHVHSSGTGTSTSVHTCMYLVVSSSKPGTFSLKDQDHYHIWKEEQGGAATTSHDMFLTVTPRQRPVAFTMETPGRWKIRLKVTDTQGQEFFHEITTQIPEQEIIESDSLGDDEEVVSPGLVGEKGKLKALIEQTDSEEGDAIESHADTLVVPAGKTTRPKRVSPVNSGPRRSKVARLASDSSGSATQDCTTSKSQSPTFSAFMGRSISTVTDYSDNQLRKSQTTSSRRAGTRCGYCENCIKLKQNDVCRECYKCRHKLEGKSSIGACDKRKCLQRSYAGASSATTGPKLSPIPQIASAPAPPKSLNGRCGSCTNCVKLRQKDVCGKCCKCIQKKKGLPSIGACTERKCLGSAALSAELHSKSSCAWSDICQIACQNKVYAKWSHNEQYYWGTVTREFTNYSAELFNVTFDDGDIRHRVPRREVFFVEEFIADMTKTLRSHEMALQAFQEQAGVDPSTYHSIRQTLKPNASKLPVQDWKSNDCLCAKYIKRKWLNQSFLPQSVTGIVKNCCGDSDKRVQIHYCASDLEKLQNTIPGCKPFPTDWIPMVEAQGYREDYDEEHRDIQIDSKAKRWIVPDSIQDKPKFPPSRIIEVMGMSIEVEARDSSIDGAGLGVFMRVNPIDTDETCFTLEAHHVIDLGMYGPFRKEDLKHDAALLVKDFIFDGKTQQWVFDTVGSENLHDKRSHGFDITDDCTGELHDQARRNVLVYINETDGVEEPTISASRDPFHFVHYLLSHDNDLVLEFNQWIELKIDYGDTYEVNRVAKGYSRLSRDSAEFKELEVKCQDHTILSDIVGWNDEEETDAAWNYLVGLKIDALEPEYMWRCLLVTLCIYKYSTKENNRTSKIAEQPNRLAEAQVLIKEMLDHVSDDDLRMIVLDARYRLHLARFLEMNVPESIQNMHVGSLRKCILDSI
eukprot:scaffold5323_cov173-Amphora_coffeaeformis.AAC.5